MEMTIVTLTISFVLALLGVVDRINRRIEELNDEIKQLKQKDASLSKRISVAYTKADHTREELERVVEHVKRLYDQERNGS